MADIQPAAGGFTTRMQRTVEWGDCDPAGIIFYPTYYRWMDAASWHLFALDDAGHALATCRLIPAGLRYAEAAIGRVACAAGVRGTGMGRALMQEALRQLEQLSPGPVRISAQQRLQGFYESLGFAAASRPYLEDNIPHLEMLKK